MIRINLLAVERPKAKKARVLIPAGASRHDRREPDSHRDRPRHRLVVPRRCASSPRSIDQDIASAETEAAEAPVGSGAGAEVRGAQGPAHAARHAHRAAAPRAVRTRARARRDQQKPARPAVADRAQAGRQRFHDHAGSPRRCPRCRISSRISKPRSGSSVRSRSSTARSRTDKTAGDLVKFSIKGAVNDPEAPPPVPAAAGRGRGAAASGAKK